MDEIGHNYLTLALNLDRHLEGFVDAYFGPPELKAEVQAGEPRPLEALAEDARQLQAAIEESDYHPQRKDFLTRQTRAMAAVIRNLSGDQLDFAEEVALYFDITPQMLDQAVFEEVHAEIDRLLPGPGSLPDRVAAWRKAVEVPRTLLPPLCTLALEETRRRTADLFDLPPGEEVSLELVEGPSWAAYNWYLGGYRSRIELNTDLPLTATEVVSTMAHEAYPGHHTERAIKEYRLYQQAGQGEQGVSLILAPENVLAEGMATSGLRVLFDDEELAGFLRDSVYPLAGLADVNPERDIAVARRLNVVYKVLGNAALLLHPDGRPAEEVLSYVERYALASPEEAAKLLKFMEQPMGGSYAFNYAVGRELLAPLLEGPDAVANFRRLLSEPLTPTQIRHWLAERGTTA